MSVKVTAATMPIGENTDGCKTPQEYIVWAARVSNPDNQANHDTGDRLLKRCLRKRHWSVFDSVDISMEIRCPRDISRQILRHWSFDFQEFSQRYAVVDFEGVEPREARMQDHKDRQSSLPCMDPHISAEWNQKQADIMWQVDRAYSWAIREGIAKECARVILPEGLTESVLIMKGSVRSWIHYCEVRRAPETQAEHRAIADLCWEQLRTVVPLVCQAVEEVASE
jgi:thymidylate synthase (FAD)